MILTMLLVLACPMVLVLPKEKPVFCVVVVWPNGLKRLPAGCWVCWPNRPPVVAPKPPVAAAEEDKTNHTQMSELTLDQWHRSELKQRSASTYSLRRCSCSVRRRSWCWELWNQTGRWRRWMWLWLCQTGHQSVQPSGWLGPSCPPGSPPVSTPAG